MLDLKGLNVMMRKDSSPVYQVTAQTLTKGKRERTQLSAFRGINFEAQNTDTNNIEVEFYLSILYLFIGLMSLKNIRLLRTC